MKNKMVVAIILLFVFSSCQKQDIERDLQEAANAKGVQDELLNEQDAGTKSFKQVVLNLRAHLSGDEEVPPVETSATGQAIFQLSKDGETLSYRLIVANIENVRMAHIHLGPAGVNGPVVAWLHPSGPPFQTIPGKTNGVLATGVIKAENLTGPLEGALSLSALVDEMIEGNTYVNVHTDQVPAGEIRGQISRNARGK
jgi:hypothetical protein